MSSAKTAPESHLEAIIGSPVFKTALLPLVILATGLWVSSAITENLRPMREQLILLQVSSSEVEKKVTALWTSRDSQTEKLTALQLDVALLKQRLDAMRSGK